MSFFTNCIKYMINTRILNYEAYDTMVSKHWLQEPKEFNYMIALTWKVLAERISTRHNFFKTNL